MDRDVESAPATYLNRPVGHAPAIWRSRVENFSTLRTTGRAVDRMLVALRAYEQRAQRRAAMRAWIIARRRADTTDARRLIAVPDAANG
jgi:hypothetical protein